MKKKYRVIIIVCIILIAAIGLGIKFSISTYRSQVQQITISDVSTSQIKDGIYTGNYETLLVSAKVKVSVKDHQITNVDLVNHNNAKGKPAEIVTQNVVDTQSLDVDIITGATASSKVILKAIENALASGLE